MSDTMRVTYLGRSLTIPSWASWLATDQSKEVWAYENKPTITNYGRRWAILCGRADIVHRLNDFDGSVVDSLTHTDLIAKREAKESDIVIGGTSLVERDMRVLPDKLSLYMISAGMPFVEGQPDRPVAQRVMAEGIYPAVMGYASGQVEEAHVAMGVNYYITSVAASDLTSKEYAVFHLDENMNIQWGRVQ